ncbi:DNA-directed RNA polymerase subunit A' [Candidatus Micrarchaeota archaeon CG10_big_fil_rev_8_21_14_0_10_45_29]|nr:MAG: DNA-directed RNA polymerase subunit A' [Candidatus Micrarchaeota archaeon CG10_big_fil_rev_8_21_14_0_10_45_29]
MIVTKMIDKIKFSLFSPEMVRKMSVVKITVPDTYNDDSYPIDGGLVDPRMGVIDPGLKDKTSGGKAGTSPGHFGHIELVRPVIHPEFSKMMLHVLQNTSPFSKQLLWNEEQVEKIRKDALENPDMEVKIKLKRPTHCPHTGEKLPEIKLLKPTTFYKNKEIMLPTEIREWLAGVSDEDIKLLGIDPEYSRPEWAVLTCLLVPPVSVRPSITLETGDRSEDDLTHKLVDIMRINQRLEANINAGAPQLIIEDLWELLQYHITTYFNNETANIPPARHRSGRPLKTLAARLKGKEGRFRYNLSGKRVNFSARTVVSPDPLISIDEVGVPLEIAEEMTVPMYVSSWNMDYCKKFISSDVYPRAEYVIRPDSRRVRVSELTRQEVLDTLAVGSIVERQLIDGDTVLFNRQPSLHRISIMCHSVKVLPGKTLRLNPIVCAPYNADFDGDEMNLHVIQSEEAKVEAEMLMKVHGQIISPRHGHAIIKPQEDYVTGGFFITRSEAIFGKDEACQILASAGITRLPAPDKKDNWSGRILFSMLLPKELNCTIKSKFRRKMPDGSEHPDNEIIIKNGIMLSGGLDDKAADEVLERIIHLKGTEAGREFLDRAGKMELHAITMIGFSVSLANYSLDATNSKHIDKLQDTMRREIESVITQYKNKTLERLPGRTLKETLEDKIMDITSKTRNAGGNVVEKAMGTDNTSIIMARIGARGSILNAIQMAAMVGQQAIRNKRPNRGYSGRVLPHYKRGDKGADAKGFVFNSFRKGLSATEFFQHSMGGRESLVNTAIRTARSGYMQRRLINALQDMIVMPDYSVRDSSLSFVQFVYGGDKVDPMMANSKKHTS